MSDPLVDEYWKTAYTEIKKLDEICAWDVIDRTDDINVIYSKCAYRLKISKFPINKSKAHFCACGDQQLEGVLLFQTYALVLQWTANSVMLILEELLLFKSKQVNVTAVFLHVNG